MYVPVRLHSERNGPGWASGWGVGGMGQGWCFFFPLHTLKRSGSHLKHVSYSLLFDCVGFGSSRGKDTDRGLNRQGDLIT